jgi:Uma2 family endonuclease
LSDRLTAGLVRHVRAAAYNEATRESREASVAITGRRLALEDFLCLPEEKPALEYAYGEVTQKASPDLWHGLLQGTLIAFVNAVGMPGRLALAAVEVRWTCGDVSYVPDVVIFTWDRIPTDENGDVQATVSIPPDVAVEVVSDGQSLRGQADRCRWYVANGVRIALLVNPRDRMGRSVQAFRPDGETEPLRGADRVDLGDVIPGFSFAVDELFAVLRARPGG